MVPQPAPFCVQNAVDALNEPFQNGTPVQQRHQVPIRISKSPADRCWSCAMTVAPDIVAPDSVETSQFLAATNFQKAACARVPSIVLTALVVAWVWTTGPETLPVLLRGD